MKFRPLIERLEPLVPTDLPQPLVVAAALAPVHLGSARRCGTSPPIPAPANCRRARPRPRVLPIGRPPGDAVLERHAACTRLTRVVPTAGHTLGHISLHLPDRDAVIAGEAVVMLEPYMAEPGPRPVCRAATADPERALASLDALAATGARTVLTGHGPVWTDGAGNAAETARRIRIP